MRSKLEICTTYLELLNSQNELGMTKKEIQEYLQDKDNLDNSLTKIQAEIESSRKLKGQYVSTVRAFFIFCHVIIHEDVSSGQRVWNSFVKRQFEMIEHHQRCCYMAHRGSGKTIEENTLIWTDKGLIPIKDVKVGDEVISIDEHELKQKTKYIHAKTKPYKKELFELITRMGHKILLSADHPLLTVNGWKKLKVGLKVGDFVACPRQIPFINKFKDINAAVIAGLLVSEGYCGEKAVRFCNQDLSLFRDLLNSCEYKNIRVGKLRLKSGSDKDYELGLNYKSVYSLLPELRNKSSYYKDVPLNIQMGNAETVKTFLKYYFEGDGGVIKGHNSIDCSSMSRILIEQIQHLLLMFGIFSIIKKKIINFRGRKFISYKLTLNGINVIKFYEHIGFVSDKKNEALNQIILKLKATKRNSNVDVIPLPDFAKELYIGDSINLTRDSLKRLVADKQNKLNKYLNGSYPKINNITSAYFDFLLETKMIDRLEYLIDSEVFWDEILSVTPVGAKTCYDLQIGEDGGNNYLANGLFVHNSYFLFGLYPLFKTYLLNGFETLICSNIPKQVKSNFRVLKRIVDHNELLLTKKDTSNMKNLIWSQTEIEYNGGFITGMSIGSIARGSHVNLAVLDDPLREDRHYTDEHILNFALSQYMPTTERKKGRIVVAGTPSHQEDLFHTLMNDKVDKIGKPIGKLVINGHSKKGFFSNIFPSILNMSTKTVLIPEAFTFERLMEIKDTLGEYRFNKEYLCKCSSPKTALISYSLFKKCCDETYSMLQVGEKDSNGKPKEYIMFVDPATSDDVKADFAACMVMEMEHKTVKKVVRHIWRERGVPIIDPLGGNEDQINIYLNISKAFFNCPIVVEQNAAGVALIQGLEREGNVPIIPHLTHMNKAVDVMTLVFDMKHEKIIIPSNPEDEYTLQMKEILKEECLNFGIVRKKGKEIMEAIRGHDDVFDTFYGCNKYCGETIEPEPFGMCID